MLPNQPRKNGQSQSINETGNPLGKRLYTLKEAARYLGRSEWGMRELIWGRKIPVVREKLKIYLDINDLDEFVRRNKSLYN
jgi:hypothetical protein